ncbi:glycosyltransferase [Paraburkholderia edwinii]|uniref:Glycosyltransferase n=1 Tax=Paraburkholderia edwinii TaxID=2861782 RepID=A0ABX8UYC3_9BURK|nr:glycosyltransferase [Paraburkholderia edwinii]QYD73282.1 glycosyltransferase [Paraburkholderia edwinii]
MNTPTPLYSRIVFWEPCVSPHKSAFINAVAERFGPGVEVSCVAHEGVPESRQALGWGDGSVALPPTVVAPSDEQIAALVQSGGDRCLHVFSGIRWFRTLTTALEIVQRERRPFAIMSEPRDNAGVAGAVRFVQSWMTEAALRRHVQFVLAIGRHGPPWFRSVGYRRERVFPFAYFLPPPAEIDGTRTSAAQLRIAYVGRLIDKKGVQFLLPAMRELGPRARLTLIGDGELRERLVAQARESGVDTEFCGVLPIEEVQRRMRDFDVLVLPSISKDDGWGAVVSEALMAGAAVVGSSCAGASILLDSPRNGRVVRPGDSHAIAAAIADLERSGGLSAGARRMRVKWARERLTARAGASYFEQIVRHRIGHAPRPKEFYL